MEGGTWQYSVMCEQYAVMCQQYSVMHEQYPVMCQQYAVEYRTCACLGHGMSLGERAAVSAAAAVVAVAHLHLVVWDLGLQGGE